VDAAEALLRKLTLRSVEWGYSFSNPALKRFWSYLETIAINYPAVDMDSIEDETAMDATALLERAGEEIRALADSLPVDPPPAPKERKRKAASAKSSKPRAKVKKEWAEGDSDFEEEEEEIDWEAAYDSGTLGSHTLAKLKVFCEEYGLKKAGIKADVVARIEDAIRARRIEDGE
jgi:hypothetical protein